MKEKNKKNSFIYFNEDTGIPTKILVFSPFFPFTNKILEGFFSDFTNEKYKKIYSVINKKIKSKTEDIITSYINLINSFHNTEIHLIGFGIFSNLFVNIANIVDLKVKSLTLFEPDFSYSYLRKIYDEKMIKFFKYNYIKKFYSGNKIKGINNYILKNKLKEIYSFYKFYKNKLSEKDILTKIINNNYRTLIIWKVMEKESWPLGQILSEDYKIPIITTKDDILTIFINKNKEIKDELLKQFN